MNDKANVKNLPQKKEPTISDRFTGMVVREYSDSISNVELTAFQRKLAQHLFVKVDIALKDFEIKRLGQAGGDKKTPFTWENINLPKLAVDTVHRIELGLDALIPNHIHPVPYFNNRKNKYDLDLRIGYSGKDYYYRKMSLYQIADIVYELVYENDKFTVIKKTANEGVETYKLDIPKPFDRGQVVGGFGYIIYDNPQMNRVVIVTLDDFKKSQTAAKSNDFWSKHPDSMKYKTIVHRTVSRIVLDPEKINASFAHVENDEIQAIDNQKWEESEREVSINANQEVIDIETQNGGDTTEDNQTEADETISNEEKEEIRQQEMKEAAAAGGPGF